MQDDAGVEPKLTATEAEQLMQSVMWRQARLSISVAGVFIALLILIPLFNLFAPGLAATPVMGFPLTWLLLGVLFYPITWGLSAYFVKRSDKLESGIAKENAK